MSARNAEPRSPSKDLPRYPTQRFASSVPDPFLKLPAALLLLGTFFVSGIAAEDRYCFENEGLKYKDTVRFSVEANRISKGTFTRATYEDEENPKISKFSGTKTGTVLTINLKGKSVYEKAKGEDTVMWSLKKQTLSIPMHGKNHTTGKYSNYDAPFIKCKP